MPDGLQPDRLIRRARQLRKNMSKPEVLLWIRLRPRESRLDIRRQVPFAGKFVLDFYETKSKLAFEIDGKVHRYKVAQDTQRDAELLELGVRVVRIPAIRVLRDPQQVACYIIGLCTGEIELPE